MKISLSIILVTAVGHLPDCRAHPHDDGEIILYEENCPTYGPPSQGLLTPDYSDICCTDLPCTYEETTACIPNQKWRLTTIALLMM
jgi:hypothetical protein